MNEIFIQAVDQSLGGHSARAHVEVPRSSVTIGVTHTTYLGDGGEPYEEAWNVHLEANTALAWARAIVAALGDAS